MYEFFASLNLMELNELTVTVRILLAMLFSGTLGFERTRKGRAAGLRTYMLVCMGATVVMMTGQFLQRYGAGDPARLGAQVICGIGFLGAGTIMVTGYHKIKGLTTAAGLWSAACMGIAIGAGFYLGAFLMCVAILFTMTTFGVIQSRYISRSRRIRLYIVFETLNDMGEYLEFARENGITVSDFETAFPEAGPGVAGFFMLQFKDKKSHGEIIEMFRHCKGLTFIEEI